MTFWPTFNHYELTSPSYLWLPTTGTYSGLCPYTFTPCTFTATPATSWFPVNPLFLDNFSRVDPSQSVYQHETRGHVENGGHGGKCNEARHIVPQLILGQFMNEGHLVVRDNPLTLKDADLILDLCKIICPVWKEDPLLIYERILEVLRQGDPETGRNALLFQARRMNLGRFKTSPIKYWKISSPSHSTSGFLYGCTHNMSFLNEEQIKFFGSSNKLLVETPPEILDDSIRKAKLTLDANKHPIVQKLFTRYLENVETSDENQLVRTFASDNKPIIHIDNGATPTTSSSSAIDSSQENEELPPLLVESSVPCQISDGLERIREVAQQYGFKPCSRDQTMAKNIINHLESGSVTVIVGSFHLPAIVDFLKEEGYLVSEEEFA